MSMSCMMLLRIKPPRLMKIYNLEKYLHNLNNRLNYNVNRKTGYSTERIDSKKRRHQLAIKLAQNYQKTKAKVEEIIERENIWTIPNFLCVGRIITTPCLSYLIVCSHDYHVSR